MNVSRRDSTAVLRGLRVVTLIFFVLSLERFINAAMASSEAGTNTALIVATAFALTGMMLGLLLLSLGTGTRSSHGRRKR